MNAKRKKVQDLIISTYSQVDKSGYNKDLYERFFSSLNDKQFDEFMQQVKKGDYIPIFANEKTKIDVSQNIKVGKKLGINFFQRLKIQDANGTWMLTPVEYPVMLMPIKRTQQTAAKSIATPEDNTRRNNLTGQVTGLSQVTKITLPEAQVLTGIGMKDTLKEMYKYHGGDHEGTTIMVNRLINTGSVRPQDIVSFSSGVKSTKVLKSFLKTAYIKMT